MWNQLARIGLITACLVLCMQATGIQARSLGALTQGNVVLQPADVHGNEIDQPGYFEITASPGSSTTLYALVGSIAKKQLSISIAPVDARSGVYGGVSYNLPTQHRKSVGSWVHISRDKVKVQPGKAALVPFAVDVPDNVKPGQYVGGLTAFVPAKKGSAAQSGKRDGSIIVQLRRVVAVVVTVPGTSYGRFAIGRIAPKLRPDAFYIITHIHNTGTMLLKGQGRLWIWKVGVKNPVVSAPLTLDTTLPGTTVHYPVFWSKRPQRGQYHYKVRVSWSGGTTVRTGTFTLKK